MKLILIILLFAFGVNNYTHAQKIISIEAEGNLESPNPCGCVEISEVTNKHNPADILNGMRKCIELKDFDKAAKLFVIAGVYGKYDTYRVKDQSAHQALIVLQQNILGDIEEENKQKFMTHLNKILEENSEEFKNLCQSIQQIGFPTYYPKYMIAHGIQAFTDNSGDGLVEEFDSEKSWNLVLKSFLPCGEE